MTTHFTQEEARAALAQALDALDELCTVGEGTGLTTKTGTYRKALTAGRKALTAADAKLAKAGARMRGVAEIGPAYGIIDPDYARVYTQARIVAWQYGYACVMHGSFTRDLDLLLVPWTEQANDNGEQLLKLIAQGAGLRFSDGQEEVYKSNVDWSDKPHGRKSCSLYFPAFGDRRWVDISVVPRVAHPQASEPAPSTELPGMWDTSDFLDGATDQPAPSTAVEREEVIKDLGLLAEKFSAGWHEGIEIDASDIMLMNQAAALLEAQPKREPLTYGIPEAFHEQASHIDPDYRDGWNAAIAATKAQPGLKPLTDAEALRLIDDNQDVTEPLQIIRLVEAAHKIGGQG